MWEPHTTTGVDCAAPELFPNSPWSLYPHPQILPWKSKPNEWFKPAVTLWKMWLPWIVTGIE